MSTIAAYMVHTALSPTLQFRRSSSSVHILVPHLEHDEGILYWICNVFCRVNKSVECNSGDQLSPHHFDSTEGSSDGGHHIDDILKEFADYGTTPPQTFISCRQGERKQREEEELW
jgi:hypothetical protein